MENNHWNYFLILRAFKAVCLLLFPSGVPKTAAEFTPAQRKIFVEMGAYRVLWSLGDIDRVLPCTTRAYQEEGAARIARLYKRSKARDRDAQLEMSRFKFEEREAFYFANIIERESARLSVPGADESEEIYFIIGGLHNSTLYSRQNLNIQKVDFIPFERH